MERSDWDDDDLYPVAPVPPHERVWRHPSEIGEVAWTRSEPPLALGRGLMVATGAVGTMLAIALLWAMLPASAGAPSAAPVTVEQAASLDGSRTARPSTSWKAVTTLTTAVHPSLTTLVSTLASTITDSTTTAATVERAPAPTVLVGSDAQMSSAVALAGSPLLVTTAKAVGDDHTVQLSTGDDALTATVVLLDAISGLAVLEPHSASAAKAFALAACTPGDRVSVLSDEPFDADVVDADGGRLALTAERSAREGTPVVNGDGRLVGLYSRDGDAAQLLRVDGLNLVGTATTSDAGSSTTVPASPAPTDGQASSTTVRAMPVWLGVQIDDDGGAVVVTSLATDGPAQRAGISAGDIITTIDGQAVVDRADVAAALAGKAPGDTVDVGYTRAGVTAVTELVVDARPAL